MAQKGRMTVDNSEWQELMTASMDFSDVRDALYAERTDDAARLIRPIEAVLKRHNQRDALRPLQKILKHAKRGQWRAALVSVPEFEDRIHRAIQGARTPKRKTVWEGTTMKHQISPEFKRAVEAEVRRLMEQGQAGPYAHQLKILKGQAATLPVGDVVDELERVANKMTADASYRQDVSFIKRKIRALKSNPTARGASQVAGDLLMMASKRGGPESRAAEGSPVENASARRLLGDASKLVLQVILGGQKIDHGGDRVQAANWKTAIAALHKAEKEIKYAKSQLT